MIGARPFTVRDIVTTHTGRGTLITCTTGEHLTLLPGTVLWAARHIDPRTTHRRAPRRSR
ncbi:hypothetical protein [Streptomyces sp. SBT349]|uniref:hypothetical protein n=1 Tax=Streptomyces sp. SBT349 TaxID=1580539 RepID=UPI00066BB175|nr:hypothetical protein [Streptomyces sp. SBT349]